MKKAICLLAFFFEFLFLPPAIASPGQFWNQQRRGANFFNKLETTDRLQAGQIFGLQFIRLAPSKWLTAEKDFLLGNADEYKMVPPADLKRLIAILDEADAVGIKVLLTSLSAPGSRWRQQNGMKWDCRLYRDRTYTDQVRRFWTDVTRAIGNHPSVVGIDPVNEPFLSKCAPAKVSLTEIYRAILDGIRSVSVTLPVVIESDNFADVQTFADLPYFDDKNVLYSFHMYEPFDFTNLKINKLRYEYLGVLPMSETVNAVWSKRLWNRDTIKEYLKPIADWQRRHKVSSTRVLAGEFGCNRTVKGCQQYLSDLIVSFNEYGWHWSFYSFREDTWPGMDFELGTKRLTDAQWKLIEEGEKLEYPLRPSGIGLMLKEKVLKRLK